MPIQEAQNTLAAALAGALYAISRTQTRPGVWCWLVGFSRRGKLYYKSFYDVRRGGPENSLTAAIAWRDQQLAAVKALPLREFCQLLRTTNTSGVAGVLFIRPANQPQGSWQARIRLPNNRILTKTFAVKTYGEREAYQLAIAARKVLLENVEDTLFLHHPLAKVFAEKSSEKKE
jgi:hypothetical protein